MIAIDVGLRGCGVAVFNGHQLIDAKYIKSPNAKGTGVQAWLDMANAVHYECTSLTSLVIIEQQRLRPGKEKGNPQNMMELQGVVGVIAGWFSDSAEVVGYYPEQWKGSVRKEVMTARIQSRLTDEELLVLAKVECAPSLFHNVIDAIGIGLFHLGRLKHEYQTPRS